MLKWFVGTTAAAVPSVNSRWTNKDALDAHQKIKNEYQRLCMETGVGTKLDGGRRLSYFDQHVVKESEKINRFKNDSKCPEMKRIVELEWDLKAEHQALVLVNEYTSDKYEQLRSAREFVKVISMDLPDMIILRSLEAEYDKTLHLAYWAKDSSLVAFSQMQFLCDILVPIVTDAMTIGARSVKYQPTNPNAKEALAAVYGELSTELPHRINTKYKFVTEKDGGWFGTPLVVTLSWNRKRYLEFD